MAISSRYSSVFCILPCLFLISSCKKPCLNHKFSKNRAFRSCIGLPFLGAHLHWNYLTSTGRIEMAYRAPQSPTGWIAWAINPTGAGMPGSQALVAFQHSNGSLVAYTTPMPSYNPSMQPGALSFPVPYIIAEYGDNEMIIFAVIGPLGNDTAVNHVWQTGSKVLGDVPQMHPTSGAHIQSLGTLDFQLG